MGSSFVRGNLNGSFLPLHHDEARYPPAPEQISIKIGRNIHETSLFTI